MRMRRPYLDDRSVSDIEARDTGNQLKAYRYHPSRALLCPVCPTMNLTCILLNISKLILMTHLTRICLAMISRFNEFLFPPTVTLPHRTNDFTGRTVSIAVLKSLLFVNTVN